MAQSFLRLLIQFAASPSGIRANYHGVLVMSSVCLDISFSKMRALATSGLPARAALARLLPGSADGLCCA
jgi:hypothetical protein